MSIKVIKNDGIMLVHVNALISNKQRTYFKSHRLLIIIILLRGVGERGVGERGRDGGLCVCINHYNNYASEL